MPDFGSFRGFSEKLTQGQTPTQLGKIGSEATFIGLLDTYPTAARAYSLRLLTSDYGGSAIRVRRSDNTEQDIGFTALGDLNTTTLLSFVGGGDGYVTTWYDQSGNGINATQTTAANQPMIVTSGVLETRTGIGVARPAVRFNNSSLQKMSFTQNLVSKSVFIVLRRRIALTDSLFWLDSGTDYDYHPGSGASPTWLEIFASTSVKNGVNKLNGTVTNLLTTAQTDGLKTISCINEGTSILRGIGGGNTSSRTWDGHQSELIIYNGDKTSTRTGIENDINTYYGIY